MNIKKSPGPAPHGSWKQKNHRDQVPDIFPHKKIIGTTSQTFFRTRKPSGPGPCYFSAQKNHRDQVPDIFPHAKTFGVFCQAPFILKEIDQLLYQLDEEKEKKEFKQPLRKLGNFLRRLGDDEPDSSKFLKGTQKVLETAQKLGRTYDKFAQWIPGLPRIPDVFLGKK